jgi:MFS family permease
VAFARSADPKLWMMGLDIPDAAFGAGWQPYRVFSTASILLVLACMLFGGLAGDCFGRRRVLLLGAATSVGAGVLAAVAPGLPWFVPARTIEVGAGAVAFPLTLAVIRLTFQGRQRPLALLA